jgi:site-specific DNA-methyltransferase (adenine-specific)
MLSDDETWRVIEGKWQESPPDEVDVVISDPPYDERTHKNGRRGAWSGDGTVISESVSKSFDPLDPSEVVDAFLSRTNRWVLCFCSIEQIGDYAKAAGQKRWIRGGIWKKKAPTPQFSGDRPGVFGDAIAIMHREGKKRWNGGGKAAIYEHSTAAHFSARGSRLHETQKPLSLMIELVKLYSEPGELVWDPYCGSGTTGVACLLTGRRFLGHEMQPRYAEIARDRLTAEAQGLTLDDYYAGQTSLFGGTE